MQFVGDHGHPHARLVPPLDRFVRPRSCASNPKLERNKKVKRPQVKIVIYVFSINIKGKTESNKERKGNERNDSYFLLDSPSVKGL